MAFAQKIGALREADSCISRSDVCGRSGPFSQKRELLRRSSSMDGQARGTTKVEAASRAFLLRIKRRLKACYLSEELS
jgi:hypothetical protein